MACGVNVVEGGATAIRRRAESESRFPDAVIAVGSALIARRLPGVVVVVGAFGVDACGVRRGRRWLFVAAIVADGMGDGRGGEGEMFSILARLICVCGYGMIANFRNFRHLKMGWSQFVICQINRLDIHRSVHMRNSSLVGNIRCIGKGNVKMATCNCLECDDT